jgi:hypothetical protein
MEKAIINPYRNKSSSSNPCPNTLISTKKCFPSVKIIALFLVAITIITYLIHLFSISDGFKPSHSLHHKLISDRARLRGHPENNIKLEAKDTPKSKQPIKIEKDFEIDNGTTV